MIDHHLAKLLGGVATVLLPAAIYLGLQYASPRWIALILLLVAGVRLLTINAKTPALFGALLALAMLMILTASTNSEIGLLAYPVLINLIMLIVFAASLFSQQTIVERLARLEEPTLSTAAVNYTRNVTWAWVLFFILNGTVAASTIFMNREVWAFYNGFFSYILMGAMFIGERIIRKRFKES